MWTGIPMTQIAEEESRRLLDMESELREHIVGQDEAIETVAKAVRRARAGLKDPHRPIGSFIFLGPTGVGKTELSRHWHASCSAPKRRWCKSICPSFRSVTPQPAWSALPRICGLR